MVIDMVNEREMQEKFITYQLLQKQLEMLREQAVQIENNFIEIETTKQTIANLAKLKKENEIMIPLGSGYFIEGKIINLKNTLMSPGMNVMVEKDFKAAGESLDEKKKDIENELGIEFVD